MTKCFHGFMVLQWLSHSSLNYSSKRGNETRWHERILLQRQNNWSESPVYFEVSIRIKPSSVMNQEWKWRKKTKTRKGLYWSRKLFYCVTDDNELRIVLLYSVLNHDLYQDEWNVNLSIYYLWLNSKSSRRSTISFPINFRSPEVEDTSLSLNHLSHPLPVHIMEATSL